ncbi:MAG: mandelate racemase/muconate lactonizing enzyme family protein [Enhydrobacter sp.]|nr:mandelate racemase/muconate lactonizing enzyme family protein [Enhydrobacter sp.]
MKIKDVEVRRYRNRGGSDYLGEVLIVEVSTDDGPTGRGLAMGSIAAGKFIAGMIEEILAPAIMGEDPLLTNDLWTKMYDAAPRRAGDGFMRSAIAAVDFALWDIKGKALGVPVSRLFGGHREEIPTYANCAHHLPPDKLAERAFKDVRDGHKALKIRGTRPLVTPAEATARVQAVREAIGPDVKLMVDVNGSWDVDTAIQQLKAWEPYDVYWLEEPVPPQDVAGYVRVRERSGSTYIAGGEQHVGLAEHRRLIEQGAVDILQPNAVVTGGITDFLRVHAFATAHSIPVSPWNLQAVHLHMAAGLSNVKWIEYFSADNALLNFMVNLVKEPAMQEKVTDEGVFLIAPKAPGLGLALDEALAEECLVKS